MNGERADLTERAALWVLRSQEPGWSAQQQAELDAWLQESPLHRVTFLRLREGWRAADRIASLGVSAVEVRGAAPTRHRARWRLAIAAAASGLIVGGIGFYLANVAREPSTPDVQAAAASTPELSFATGVGGRASVPLPDGSRVELNTATAVRARVNGALREVWLDRGEAYFEVAARRNVPFKVYAGPRTLTVLGTRFAVRRDEQKLTVAVAAGKVRIDDARNPKVARSTTLVAGDLAVARGISTLVAVHAEERVGRLLAWLDGMLNFTDTRLADVVAEFNRYHDRKIVIGGAATANIRIDGAIQASNVEAFLWLLHDAYKLEVTETGDSIKISAP